MDIRSNEKKWILIISITTSFITTFVGSALNLSIPQIEETFNASAQEVNWVITAYMLTCGALAVPFGKIGDNINRRTILWIGLLFFSSGSILSAFSNRLTLLIVNRVIQGFGAAMIFSSNIAILVSCAEKEEKGKLLGYATGANYVGLSLGPVIGGFLNNSFGWKAIFIVTAAISFVAFCGVILKIPNEEKKNEDNSKDLLNWKSMFIYISSICFIMYGLSSIGSTEYGKYVFVSGIVIFIIYVFYEAKTPKPIVNVRFYFQNKNHTCANLAAFFNYGAIFATSYLISIYLQIIRDYNSAITGIILVSAPVVQAMFSPFAGKLSDRYPPQLISSIGAVICAVSLFFFSFISFEGSISYLIIILMIEGLGCAFFSAPNSSAVIMSALEEDYGIASSVLSTMRSIGHTTSMAMLTLIFNFTVGSYRMETVEPQLLLETIHICLYIFTVWCIIGFFMALRRNS